MAIATVRESRAVVEHRDENLIEARDLLEKYTVDELNAFAEEYFARIPSWDYHLAKPLGSLAEAPVLLTQVAKLVQGLGLLPDHEVLDFGAGSCWLTRILTQLGCKVYALDVSPTALRMGETLFARQPIIGFEHPPTFLRFDGRRIPLADAAVDRIICFDALHHVPNRAETLHELGRVLRTGGIAGFCEPGPHHARSPQAQFEMAHFRVLENDTTMEEVWAEAQAAGFTDLRLGIYDAALTTVSYEVFSRFLDSDRASENEVLSSLRGFLAEHRLFFLSRGAPASADSRSSAGLAAEIGIEMTATRVPAGSEISGRARVVNIGTAVWLPGTARVGHVMLGAHLLDSDGGMIDQDYFRVSLMPGAPRPVSPGEVLELELAVPAPPAGRYLLEFDLVAESVCWFALAGSAAVRIPVEVHA
jgi:SAM-dependent methyltransferase